jgi:hypothetical protein
MGVLRIMVGEKKEPCVAAQAGKRPVFALVSFAGQASHAELGWFKLNCLYFARI